MYDFYLGAQTARIEYLTLDVRVFLRKFKDPAQNLRAMGDWAPVRFLPAGGLPIL